MTKKLIIILLVVFVANLNLFAQDEDFEMWYKLQFEASVSNKRLDVKVRPLDYTILPTIQKARMDFMIGVKIWKFTIYDYTKLDNKGGYLTGPRVDFNQFLADKKLFIHLQARYFFALNETSHDHMYQIQLFTWRFNDWLSAGFLGYGKWNTGVKFDEGMWFMGPILILDLPYHFEFELAETKNIFDSYTYMTQFIFKYKLKL